MRTLVVSLAALALLTPQVVAATPAAAAAPAIKFGRFQADAPGNDRYPSASSLNTEYIVITNTTSRAINIGRYQVTDRGTKHRFVVPAGFTLGPRKSVVLHSGKGRNSAGHLYWGQSVSGAKPISRNGFVWNNSGDTATLINASGKVLVRCTYTRNSRGWVNC